MVIKNVKVYTEEKQFLNGIIGIKNSLFDKIVTGKEKELDDLIDVAEHTRDDIIDGRGCYAIPGLIDLHFHGCREDDFCDGTKEAIARIAAYEESIGVTAIAPATMTLPVEELEKVLAAAAEYKKKATNGADFIGINMEGPFISRRKKGAQDEKNIIACDTGICQHFIDISGGLVKFVGIAPEENANAIDFIRQMKEKVNISLAHTDADYETAKAAFDAGANHVVHLYNAMPAFHHRNPGVVGAVCDSRHVMAELICDGVHVHPATVRATFKMLGENRIILISDSMRATGMANGQYTLGGLKVNVKGNRAMLVSDGTLAGSVTNLMDCVRIAVKEMEIPLETVVACVTMNPAKSLGEYEKYGSISVGKKANVVLLNKELELKVVIKDGKIAHSANGFVKSVDFLH